MPFTTKLAKSSTTAMLVLLLIAAFILSPVSAADPQQLSTSDMDPIKLTYYYPGMVQNDQQLVEDRLNSILREKIGVELNLEPMEWSDYELKIKVMLAAGEPMDLMYTSNWLDFKKYLKLGVLTELNGLMDRYAPKLKQTLNPVYLSGTAYQGKNYAIPNQTNSYSWKGILLNKRLVDKYKFDISKIKKLSDLEPMLKIVKAKEKSAIPVFGKVSDFELSAIQERVGEGPGAVLPGKGTKLVNEFATPEMKSMLRLYYDWSQKGYIQNAKQKNVYDGSDFLFRDTARASRTFAVVVGNGYGFMADSISEWTGIPWTAVPLQGPYVSSDDLYKSMISIPITSKHPDKAMELIELLHTDKQVLDMLVYGIEGIHWEKSAVGAGRIDLISRENAVYGYVPMLTGDIGNPVINSWPANVFAADQIKQKAAFDRAKRSPILGFLYEANYQEGKIQVLCREFITQMDNQPQNPDKVLPAFLQKLKKAGVEAYIASKQKQMNAFLSGASY